MLTQVYIYIYIYTDTSIGNMMHKYSFKGEPVPMNMTRCFSPSAAWTWWTTMRVNVAPLRTRRGSPPIGWIAWSKRGLSLINWRVGSGRARVSVMPALRASLSIHWWGVKGEENRRVNNKLRWHKDRTHFLKGCIWVSILFLHTMNSHQTHSSGPRDRDFSAVHNPFNKRGFYGDWSLVLSLCKHFADVGHAVHTHCRQIWGVPETHTW